MTTVTFVDYYKILNASTTASEAKIQEAVQRERRVWYKKQSSPDPKRVQEAENRMRDIDAAEMTLLDSEKRKRYDVDLVNRPAPPTETRATDGNWVETAEHYLNNSNPYSANYAARQAVASDGSNHRAWWIRAHSSNLMGNLGDAEYEFKEAISLKPDDAEYHFDFGSMYEAAAKWRLALDQYEAALQIDPGNPMYRTAIASVYLNNGLTEKALPIMESVVKDHPDVGIFKYYLAWALVDNYGEYATVLKDGSFVLTHPAQIARLRRDMERARGFNVKDQVIQRYIRERLSACDDAQATRWKMPSLVRVWVIPALILLAMLFSGDGGAGLVGLLGLGGLTWLFFGMYHLPGWKINAKAFTGSSRVEKWGITA